MAGVLVLNASLEPLHVVDLRHAIRMLVREVAVVHEADTDRTFGSYPVPRVLRLVRYVVMRWRYRSAGWSRAGVFARDAYRCCYCGRAATTIDHVLPRSRGGRNTWRNSVACCSGCNQRKADRTPREAGMRLRTVPYAPTWAQLHAP